MKVLTIGVLAFFSITAFANTRITETYSVVLKSLGESTIVFQAKDGSTHKIICTYDENRYGDWFGYKRYHNGVYDLSNVGKTVSECKNVIIGISKSLPTAGTEFEIKVEDNNVVEVNKKI